MLTCFDVADYFLSRCDDESGDLISNLKLQKLVYYAQGFSLALLGEPLFEEKIEAWMHGPVVAKLYGKYKKYGKDPLPFEGFDESKFTEDQLDLLDEVYDVYGQFSAWKLRNMTHEEEPWSDTYIDGAGPISIPNEKMESFFKTLVVQ
ncbi:Panacea domain-containing protein [Morganella morganii]|uniref:Panacea domain-containing protein n=1 Tax=Morganella morganii TaxID=582 RepID=UPI00128D792E|nr:type II toxin-antitoxin system antitoxin SocA domain-containing protein [Morganella morganii]MQC08101.1 hypothetical protein [Morganella morganii]MQC10043.1 hypothetical protein [Morganella morganii]MQC13292.1 hypothetical protein [Morganella morganii]